MLNGFHWATSSTSTRERKTFDLFFFDFSRNYTIECTKQDEEMVFELDVVNLETIFYLET